MARVPGGAAVDARAAGGGDVPGDVRGDGLLAAFQDEVPRVTGLVGAQSDPPPASHRLDEFDRRQRLGVAGRARRHASHDQPAAVLHQRVPETAELRRLAEEVRRATAKAIRTDRRLRPDRRRPIAMALARACARLDDAVAVVYPDGVNPE